MTTFVNSSSFEHFDMLQQLGVRSDTLSDEQKSHLDEFGFLIVENLLTTDQLKDLKIAIDDRLITEGAGAGSEFILESGNRRLSNLINKGSHFDALWLHPVILAAAQHVMGRPFKFSSMNMRECTRDHGHQALHADWHTTNAAENFSVLNAIVAIDPLNNSNGAPRYIPGSHRFKSMKEHGILDPKAPHPDEKVLICDAGTAFIMNAHLWHGGRNNWSGKRRRTLHSYYCAREVNQQLNQAEYLLKSTWDRLSIPARYLMDVI